MRPAPRRAWVHVLAAKALRDVYSRALDSATVSAEQEEAQRFKAGECTRDVVAESAAQRTAAHAQLVEAHPDMQATRPGPDDTKPRHAGPCAVCELKRSGRAATSSDQADHAQAG